MTSYGSNRNFRTWHCREVDRAMPEDASEDRSPLNQQHARDSRITRFASVRLKTSFEIFLGNTISPNFARDDD